MTDGVAEAAGLGVETGEAVKGPGIDAMRFWVAGAEAEGAGVGTCAAEGAAVEEDADVAREDRALRRDSADDGRGTAEDEAESRGAGVRDGAGVDDELEVDGAGVDAERAVAARGGASVDGAGWEPERWAAATDRGGGGFGRASAAGRAPPLLDDGLGMAEASVEGAGGRTAALERGAGGRTAAVGTEEVEAGAPPEREGGGFDCGVRTPAWA